MKILPGCIIILFFISCSQNDKGDPLSYFPDPVSITGEPVSIDHTEIYQGGPMLFFGKYNSILLFNWASGKNILDKIDLTRDTLLHVLKRGNGPDEFSMIRLNQKLSDSSALFTTVEPTRIFNVYLNNNYRPEVRDIINTEFPFNYILLTRYGQYIATGLFKEGRFKLYDPYTKVSSIVAGYPDDGVKASAQEKFFAYQGKMMSNPEKDRFVFACRASALFEIFRIQKNSVSLIKQSHLSFPNYQPASQGKSISARLTAENKWGYTDIYTTSRFIYMIYSGRRRQSDSQKDIERALMGNTVLVFDWDGNPVKCYQTGVDIRDLCVSDDDKALYATAFNPDIMLLKFLLD